MAQKPTTAHVLVVPFPAQGHVLPFMTLSNRLVDCGVKVTFVCAKHIQTQIEAAVTEKDHIEYSRFRLVWLPDGMDTGDSYPTKLIEVMPRVMRTHIEDLIRKFNESDDGKEEEITCVIVDPVMGWVLEVAKNMGIKKRAAFVPWAVFGLAKVLQIPKLIEDGIIDENGIPINIEVIQESGSTPMINTANFRQNNTNDLTIQKTIFRYNEMVLYGIKFANWILCNSIYEFEPTSCDIIPGILPIGPMLPTNRHGQPSGNFWQEDSSCLSWLDEQPICSVIYISFGSSTVFNQQQFDELAHGIELIDRPFLWVVRQNIVNGVATVYEDGSEGRIPHCGKIVSWAPQQKVLAHPSIACFLSHCGWNSTIEGFSSGVPFLCWPYIADQFDNQNHICDVWKVGLRLNADENGTISRDEIKKKVEQLLCDEGIKARALGLKEMAKTSISEGGSSWKNFEKFLEHIKN